MWQKLKNIYHLLQAVAASVLYGMPARKLTVIGVTGTDGKTTTAQLIYDILKAGHKQTASVTTLGAIIGAEKYDTGLHVTTPSPFAIQKLLSRAVAAGCTHIVLEVSSHALDQNRVFGIPFAVGVLTNISPEHLDYHKSMERYTTAKMKLLRKARVCILNADDSSYEKIRPLVSDKKIYTYSLRGKADLTLSSFPFETKLPGEFNKANSLAAALTARALEIPDQVIREALAAASVPKGRAETVYDKGFKIIIDFAVTPNAFEQILSETRKNTRGRLIHLFGMAGRRDTMKRPVVGEVSSRFADIIILTADDPRDERLDAINAEIKKNILGFTVTDAEHYRGESVTGKLLFEISDREKAIRFAVRLALHDDTVLLTGKGHEQSLAIGSKEIRWDEYEVVRQALIKKVQ